MSLQINWNTAEPITKKVIGKKPEVKEPGGAQAVLSEP